MRRRISFVASRSASVRHRAIGWRCFYKCYVERDAVMIRRADISICPPVIFPDNGLYCLVILALNTPVSSVILSRYMPAGSVAMSMVKAGLPGGIAVVITTLPTLL